MTDFREVGPQLKRQLAEALVAGKYRKAARIRESMLWWDDFGGSDLWDSVRPRSNDDADGLRWVPLSVPSDRRHGAQWPVWRTQQELDEYRQQSRIRLATNSYAKGLLKNLTNNVIGKGFTYEALPITQKGQEATGTQTALAAQVQAIVDEFCRLNNWNGGTHPDDSGVVVNAREKEIYRRVKGDDGEAFLRFHYDEEDGTCLVRFIEPEQVRDSGGLMEEGWTFGIQHQMEPFEDVETPVTYRVFWPDPAATGGEGADPGEQNGTWQDIDADEVLHIKGPDTPATVKRGLSGFLFDVGRALDRAARLQRNASLGATYRAATAEIWQHSVGTQQQIQDLATGLGVQVQAADGGLETVERVRPPAVRRVPAGQELVPMPPDQSESYLAAGQGDLRQAAAAFAAPEFWMAETSSGNYSNLESAAAPAVRDGTSEQEYYKSAFARAIWKAVMWAVKCGRLPANIDKVVKIEVDAPSVLHRNEQEKAQQDQVYVQMKVKSPQMVAAELGVDYEVAQTQIEAHEDRWGSPMDQLQQPGEEKPGEGEGGDEGGNGKPPGEVALLKAVAWGMQKGKKALGLAEALESLLEADSGDRSPIDAAILRAAAEAAREALAHVYEQAGVEVEVPSVEEFQRRLAKSLLGNVTESRVVDADGVGLHLIEGWVTIGAHGGKEEEDPHGGTRVFIGQGGKIEKGPAHMVGKKPTELKGSKKKGGDSGGGAKKEEPPAKKDPKPAPKTAPKNYGPGHPDYERHRNAVLDAADDALNFTAEGQGGAADLRQVYAWAKAKDKTITPEQFRQIAHDLHHEKGGAQLHIRNEVRDLSAEDRKLMPQDEAGHTLGYIGSGKAGVKGVAHLKRPAPKE